MIETVAFGSTVNIQKKSILSQSFAFDSNTRMSYSECHDALSLSISNEHQATRDIFMVFFNEHLVMLLTLCSTGRVYSIQVRGTE